MNIYDTHLVPYLVAEKVVNEYISKNKKGIEYSTYEKYVKYLESKSERMFDSNTSWRSQLCNSKDERQFLHLSMVHWLESHIKESNAPLLQIEMFHNINLQLNLFN